MAITSETLRAKVSLSSPTQESTGTFHRFRQGLGVIEFPPFLAAVSIIFCPEGLAFVQGVHAPVTAAGHGMSASMIGHLHNKHNIRTPRHTCRAAPGVLIDACFPQLGTSMSEYGRWSNPKVSEDFAPPPPNPKYHP